jgi:hypothetical protein
MTTPAQFEKFLAAMDKLTRDSSSEEFDAVGSLFSTDCTAYLLSMREYEEPSIGRQAVVDKLKETLQETHTYERQILHQSTTGTTVFCEMNSTVHVLGEKLNPFYETWVVTFDEDGLVKDLKKYSCRSHIVEIVQQKTGNGPYAVVPETKGQPIKGVSCCK